jgi:hypothetical protein
VSPAPKKFFISYAHGAGDEEDLAGELNSGLTAAGHEVFIDTKISRLFGNSHCKSFAEKSSK